MIDISIALGDDPSTWSGGVVISDTIRLQDLIATGVPELLLVHKVHEIGSGNVFYRIADPRVQEVTSQPDSMTLALKEATETSPTQGYGSDNTEMFEFSSAFQHALMVSDTINNM